MSSRERKARTTQRESKGVFHWALSLTIGNAWRLLVWSLAAIALSILTEWIGMGFWWGPDHSQQILDTEVGYLSDFNRNLLLGVYPADLAALFISSTYSFFEWSGLNSLSTSLNRSGSAIIEIVGIGLQSAINITFIFATRMAISLTAITGFVIVSVLGFIDGLTEREIRKSCGGIESSFKYHYSKRFIAPSFIFAFALYLTLPVSIHPLIIFMPAMFVTGYTIFVTAATFKKFL